MANEGFLQNYKTKFELQIDGSTYAPIAAGINSASMNGNENIDQSAYYDGEGMASSDVTGGQLTYDFSGHRVNGDAAQDYIASLLMEYGESRKTKARVTFSDGSKVEGDVTIVNIVIQGGDPNAKQDFSFGIHFNGKPTFTPAE